MLDNVTHNAMLETLEVVEIIEMRQGLEIACFEEIAWKNDWVNNDFVLEKPSEVKKNGCGKYLKNK